MNHKDSIFSFNTYLPVQYQVAYTPRPPQRYSFRFSDQN